PIRHLPPPDGRGWLLYQCSVGSDLADLVLHRPEPLVVNYHNVTPARFFRRFDPARAHASEQGRRQLSRLASRASFGLADSSYNEAELAELGYAPTGVAPLLVDLSVFDQPADRGVVGPLRGAKRGGGADLLFVGRVTPNKAHHDLVASFAAYRRLFDPAARLHLVGQHTSTEYVDAVRQVASQLGVTDAVHLPGSVSEPALAAYYRCADVYVCLSDHEGFCAPVVEAMHRGVPVIAFAAAAVPETVGDAALLLGAKDPVLVATAISRVVTDDGLRQRLVAAGRARAGELDVSRTRNRFADAIREMTAQYG
ncbi:MAG: glycosyltransferase, partial [Nocardioidaceae bacterium]